MSTRRGMTLTELLVVVSILAVLLALTLPAIMRIRETYNSVSCKNNLRMLGLALQHYHTNHGFFPPGLTSESGGTRYPYLSWSARLLPYLEQDKLWSTTTIAFAADRWFLNNPPHSAAQEAVSIFVCPTDGRSQRPSSPKMGLLHYLGVGGTNRMQRDGTFFLDSCVRIADISDGASNTIIVGERPPGPDMDLGWWYGGWGQAQDGSCEVWLGVRELNVYSKATHCDPGPYHFVVGKEETLSDVFHFWSNHPKGANFLFGDMSVRFLHYNADRIMPALATIAGKDHVQSLEE